MTAYAPLPDAELVQLARAGERPAFAVLYHRHVGAVYEVMRTSVPDLTVARSLTVATFSDALRHLDRLDPDRAGEALLELARRRASGHTRGQVPALTVGVVDAMWRELDRRWPTGEPPRKEPGLTAAVTIGALVATLVLGAMVASSRRSGTPDATRTFEASALTEDPGPAEDLIGPLPRPSEDPTEEATLAPTPEAPSPTPTPSPTPEPTPEPSAAPSPTPEPSPTVEEDQAPQVSIISPGDGETRGADGTDEQGAYATFTLEASATDDRDPADALSYSWTSSLDGALLDAPSGTVRLHLPDGQLTAQHRLQVTVTDRAGNVGSATVTVIVTRV